MSDAVPEHAVRDHDDPTAGTTVFVGVVSVCLLIAIVVALEALYYRTAASEDYRKIVAEQPEELRRVRAEQLEQLSGYRWTDKAKGVAAIPIDRAMELMVEEARRTAGGED